MRAINCLYLFILIVILSGCESRQSNETVNGIDTVALQFVGMWQVVPRVIPYGALLTLDSNKNFTYHGGACLMHFGSSGIWYTLGDTLVLNSHDTSACLYTNPFGVNCWPLDSSYTRDKTIEDCEPDDGCFEYIIFTRERFLLINDTIFHVRRAESPCPQVKDNFYRFRKKVGNQVDDRI